MRTRKNSSRISHRRAGASAVEFAIVAPIFFLMVFGIIEFGRMVMVQQVITNAAREGARVAVLDSATESRVRERVNDYLKAASLPSATVVIAPSPPTSAGFDEPVSVEVRMPFSAVNALSRPFLSGNAELSSVSIMRRETVE